MNLSIKTRERIENESGKIFSIAPLVGGMRSKVFRIDTQSGRSYVAKIHHRYHDDRGFSKFENEVESLSTLSSLGISPRPLFVDRDNLTILSEFIEGLNLEQYFANNNDVVPLEKTVDIMVRAHTQCLQHPFLFYRDAAELGEAIELYRSFVGEDNTIMAIEKYRKEIVRALLTQKEHFILGDTFASNFVISNSIYFVDAELCSRGPAVIDLCQMASDLSLCPETKRRLVHAYEEKVNMDGITEAFDAATIYMNLFMIGIYSREMKSNDTNIDRREIMRSRVEKFKQDLYHLISNAEFSRYLREERR